MRRGLLLLLLVAAVLWAAPGALAAGWCGTGTSATDRPDVTTGQQVHAVVALPSDAPDTFAGDANRLADDVSSSEAWWQGQDPTRIPRYDEAVFGGSACLDITFVRLPSPASAYSAGGANAAFDLVSSQLGLNDTFKAYLVYFDGPSVQDNVCGTGGGDFNFGPSYAIVWLQGCPGVPTDTVATHELLHALGAVDPRDPHCPANPAHPCDSPTDVLYPTTDGAPLASKVLDVNHDDYYGHSGSWNDIQDSLWLHRLDVPQVALEVALSGAGDVQSDLPGIDCSVSCTTQWDPGSQVTLTALPAGTDRFVRWSGACSGRDDCLLSIAQAASATAVFGPLRIAVRVTASGRGKVTCSPKCGKTVAGGDQLVLRAVAAKGWRFAGWSGACRGTRPTCRPATDFALSARAIFRRR